MSDLMDLSLNLVSDRDKNLSVYMYLPEGKAVKLILTLSLFLTIKLLLQSKATCT